MPPYRPFFRHSPLPLKPSSFLSHNFTRPILAFVTAVFILALSPTPTSKPPSNPQKIQLPQLEELSTTCPSTRNRPLYIFTHLHKTGGNTLKRILFTFAHRNNLTLYHTCHKSLPSSFLTSWWLNRPRYKPSNSLDCNLDELQSMSIKNQTQLDFIIGHQHHGVHTLFHNRIPRYFTFMRHPLQRKISHFYHFEHQQQDQQQNISTLVHYLLSDNRNYMTKRLATRSVLSELSLHFRSRAIDVDPFAARAALDTARTHLLKHFFFIGMHHRYTESVCILLNLLSKACRYGSITDNHHHHRHNDFDNTQRLYNSFLPNLSAIDNMSDNVRGFTDNAMQSLSSELKKQILMVEKHDMNLFRLGESLFERQLEQFEQCRDVTTHSHIQI